MTGAGSGPADLSGALDAVEALLLGEAPSLTRVQVAEQAGVPIEIATELWRLLGFAHTADDEVAFTPADVDALRHTAELVELGILSPERQSALVRTWGRSYARLAEWQTALLVSVALEREADPAETFAELTEQVLPRVEALQSYVWRRHLASAGSRMLATTDASGDATARMAVVFVDIVGYTSRSKTLSEAELVSWLESFESETTDLVASAGGRIIKNIGDEVLFVADDVAAAADVAVAMTMRGRQDGNDFPEVRAGLAYGDVVSRLGDVYGPTVNVAARLTSVAHPSTVIVDRGAYEALSGRSGDDELDDHHDAHDPDAAYSFRRIRRVSVKGYSRLAAWTLRPRAQ